MNPGISPALLPHTDPPWIRTTHYLHCPGQPLLECLGDKPPLLIKPPPILSLNLPHRPDPFLPFRRHRQTVLRFPFPLPTCRRMTRDPQRFTRDVASAREDTSRFDAPDPVRQRAIEREVYDHSVEGEGPCLDEAIAVVEVECHCC